MMKTIIYSADKKEKQRILFRLADVLKNRSDIQFSYVYGSFIGELPFHDIDVAVYFTDDRKETATLDTLELSQVMSAELRIPVDVRALNFTSIPFQYQAIRGLLLYEKDQDFTARFVERTVRRYLDIKPFLLFGMKEAFAA